MKHFLLGFAFLLLLPKTFIYSKSFSPASLIPPAVHQDTIIAADSVNIGYQHVSKNRVTGAISTITEKQLQQGAMFSVDQALKGRAAGVQVTQNSGMPGAAASVRVRGVSTLFNTAEPLYVLDGVPLMHTDAGSANQFLPVLDFINLNDIATVEILKDAGATAIYGSRASNGVVLITTKRGQAKANQVTYHSYLGLQQVPKQMSMLNATEYAGLVNEVLQERGQVPRYTPEQLQTLGKGTNWQDEIFRVAPLQNHQLNYTGGSAAHRVFAGAGYTNQQGVVIQSGLQRYNFRLNYDGQIGKKLKVGVSSFISTIKNRPAESDIIRLALVAPPVWKTDDSASDFRNPIKNLKEDTASEAGKSLWGNVFAEYQILSGLFLKVNYGIMDVRQEGRRDSESTSSFNSGFTRNTTSFANKTSLLEATVNYRKTWRKHSFSLLSGYTSQLTNTKTAAESSRSADGAVFRVLSDSWDKTNQKWISYFGQLQYNFADRYFLFASVRKDGSPYFRPQDRYTLSPAIAAGWQVLNPNQAGRIVQSLKLRTSYGQTANAYLPRTGFSTNIPINPGSVPKETGYGIPVQGDSPTTGYRGIIHRELVPEKTRQINFGADVSILSNRIQLSTDIYQRKTSDAIANLTYGPSSNPSYSLNNVADIRNRGLEISINSSNLKGPVSWHTAFTFAANQNKITDLKEYTGILSNNTFYSTEGRPVNSFYGYKTDGLYQQQNEIPNAGYLGTIKYQDLNNNRNLNDDRTIIGSAQPKFIYSLDNSLSFKNFETTIFLQGVQGNEIYNDNRKMLDNFFLMESSIPNNSSRKTLHHWTANRPDTDMPRLNSYVYNRENSDYYVENGSFLRLQNVTLAYNLPQKFTIRNKIVQAKVYISGQNLFTFTNYSGYDPELGSRSALEQGWDSYNYPISRTYLAGLKITW